MTSLRVKLAVAAVLLLSAFTAVVLLFNSLLLERYYIARKRASFVRVHEEIRAALPAAAPALMELVRRLGTESGYKIVLADRDGRIRLSSSPEFTGGRLELPKEQKEYLLANAGRLAAGIVDYGPLDKGGRGQSVVQLVARVDERDFLVVTQPLEDLRDSVRIAVGFLAMVAAAVLALAAAAVAVAAGRIVRPILEITDIAAAIAGADFSRRYQGRERDEIGLLGASMNTISQRLSGVLSDLKDANDRLRADMELQKRFLASVSHELKTPVGLIRGFAESLALGMEKSFRERGELAGIIISEADRLARLVSDITLVVRMEAGALPLDRRTIEAAEVLRDSQARFAIEAERLGVALRVEAEPAAGIAADPHRLAQVVDNLLSNALRHTPAGGRVRVRAESRGAVVRFSVANTGPLIPAEHLPHLFKAFYRADPARSRTGGGSGLGLSIVRGIVAAHGGECGADNGDDGPQFWFTIPAAAPRTP